MTVINKIAYKISDYNRTKKYDFFMNRFKPGVSTKILDVGAGETEYQKEANILEKKYPYQESITVLGIENFKEFFKRYPKVKVVKYPGRKFPFADSEFDICWCNAVIEHVGDKTCQKEFLSEIRRVAKSAFVTTPNRLFPFETHTRIFLLHFLPKRFFDFILVKMGKSWATGNHLNLLSLRDIKKMLEECNITEYKIVKRKILCFTINFEIIF